MIKDLIKNSGLLVILAGVIILGVVVFTEVQNNSNLGISLGLIIGGLLAHIFINRSVD
jgi:lipoprotein signal peptidase